MLIGYARVSKAAGSQSLDLHDPTHQSRGGILTRAMLRPRLDRSGVTMGGHGWGHEKWHTDRGGVPKTAEGWYHTADSRPCFPISTLLLRELLSQSSVQENSRALETLRLPVFEERGDVVETETRYRYPV